MEFVCRVGTPDGRVVDEVHQAQDERTLRNELEKKGYHLFELRRRGLLANLRALGWGEGQKIPMRSLLIFNQELAALLRSGLPMLQALGLMLERQREPFFRSVLRDVGDQVRSGEELSRAIDSYGALFPPLYGPTLRAGERSGEMETVLRRFVRHQKLLMDTRRQVVSALVYPAALVGLSIALISVMTVYVLPRFTDFFSALDVDLPLLTRITMGFSLFVKDNLLFIVAAVALVVVAVSQWGRSQTGRVGMARFKLKLPLLGPIFHRMALSELCRSLSTLLAGGIPLVDSLEVAIRAVGNDYIRARLAPMVDGVREGKSLADTLEKSGVGFEIAIDMVKVGEATGSLDVMLEDASNFLDEEVETRLERVLSLLEPVMMMLMGIIVATLLVSVYLPIFSLLGNVKF
ncbi:MAG: type II secretion system F family protein [Thermoanaerobaculia bacterium]